MARPSQLSRSPRNHGRNLVRDIRDSSSFLQAISTGSIEHAPNPINDTGSFLISLRYE